MLTLHPTATPQKYALTFKADGGAELKDSEAVLNEDKKSYKFLTKDGDASATFANGDTFTGTYAGLKRNGKGKYVFKKQEGWASEASFSGEYKDDAKNGMGTFVYPDGSKYVGEWVNDERQGQGTYTYANGDVYRGEWKAGRKNGVGIYTYATGSRIKGVWNDGQVSQMSWNFAGGQYVGAPIVGSAAPAKAQGVIMMQGGNAIRGAFEKQLVADEENEGQMKEDGPAQWRPARLAAKSESKKAQRLQRVVRRAKFRVDSGAALQVEAVDAVDGVVNLTALDEAPPKVYGFGTPSAAGLANIKARAKQEEAGKLVVVVLRQDPVCYVSDGKNALPVSPCPRTDVGRDYDFTTPGDAKDQEELLKQLAGLEISWVARVRSDSKGESKLVYMDAGADGKAAAKELAVNAETTFTPLSASRGEDEGGEIKSFLTGAAESEEEDSIPIEYANAPIPESGAPSAKAVDALLKVLKGRDLGSEAIGFMSRTGRGSAQFGMAAAGLLYLAKNPPAEPEAAEEEKKEEGGEEGADEAKAKEAAEVEAKEAPPADLSKGEYGAIVAIVKAIADGKGAAYKADVDATIARCNQGLDLLGCIAGAKKAFDGAADEDGRAAALADGRNAVTRYATLLLAYAFLKEKLEDDEATFDGWLAAPEQKASSDALKSLESFNWA